MTAAVRAQLLAAGAKLPVEAPKKPATPRTPLPAPKEPREPGEAGKSPQTSQREYYPHPYHVQVANGTHYPGRVRIVITGPAAESLPPHLVAALQEFIRLTELTP